MALESSGAMLVATIAWTDTVTAIFTAATAVILFGSGVLALRQLREAQRTRYSDLIVSMTGRWAEAEVAEAQALTVKLGADEILGLVRKMWEGRAKQNDEDRYYTLIPLPNFIEVIAATGLTVEAIDSLWGGAILATWEKWHPAVNFVREQHNASRVFVQFESLANKITEHRANRPRPPLPLMVPAGRA